MNPDFATGPSFAGGLAFRVGAKGAIELSVLHGQHSKQDFEGNISAGFVDYVWWFGRNRRTQLFTLVGLGYAKLTDRQTFWGGDVGTTHFERSGGCWGIGWDVHVKPALSLRPQFRATWGKDWGIMQGFIAAAYRF